MQVLQISGQTDVKAVVENYSCVVMRRVPVPSPAKVSQEGGPGERVGEKTVACHDKCSKTLDLFGFCLKQFGFNLRCADLIACESRQKLLV